VCSAAGAPTVSVLIFRPLAEAAKPTRRFCIVSADERERPEAQGAVKLIDFCVSAKSTG
jgi:hypothetical protein